MSATNLDRASMEDFRNMAAALADAEARLAAVDAQFALVRDHILTDRAHSHCPARAALRADPPETTRDE